MATPVPGWKGTYHGPYVNHTCCLAHVNAEYISTENYGNHKGARMSTVYVRTAKDGYARHQPLQTSACTAGGCPAASCLGTRSTAAGGGGREGGEGGVYSESYTRKARFLTGWDQRTVALWRRREEKPGINGWAQGATRRGGAGEEAGKGADRLR